MNLDQIKDIDSKYYMDTYGLREPIAFSNGKGTKLYSVDGGEYTDFLAGVAVNALGYQHPEFTAALHKQVDALLHCSNHFYIESQAFLAKALIEMSDFDRTFISNSGTEANECAVKLVRKYHKLHHTGRFEIISADNSFHGRTLAMVAATGQVKYQEPYTPLPEGFLQVKYNNIAALKAVLSDKTAAIFLEVIQGEGGVIVADAEYLKQVQQLCDDNGILLVIDEVQTGMGRTGKLFGYQNFDIAPDIITLAKALGNGIPIGATLATEKACAFAPSDHGTTFGGNPLACAAALSVIDIFKKENIINKAAETGGYFKEKLLALAEKHSCVRDVRGIGLILGLELNKNASGKDIVLKLLKKGQIINCAGNNTLRFIPPLIISTKEIDNMVDILDTVLAEYDLESV